MLGTVLGWAELGGLSSPPAPPSLFTTKSVDSGIKPWLVTKAYPLLSDLGRCRLNLAEEPKHELSVNCQSHPTVGVIIYSLEKMRGQRREGVGRFRGGPESGV